jgi:hypothetical protein
MLCYKTIRVVSGILGIAHKETYLILFPVNSIIAERASLRVFPVLEVLNLLAP